MAGPEKYSSAGTARTTPGGERWLLKYADRIYGPYTFEAMKSYIAEGRVITQSVIAPEGSAPGAEDWQHAASIPAFADIFAEMQSPAPVSDAADASAASPASEQPAANEINDATRPQSRPAYGSSKGQIDRRRQPETSNFIVVMDIKARYAGALEQAIMSLGPAYKLAPNVWCVNTNGTAAGLLNDLSQHIGKTDSMFIVDATRDRTAWCNFGPETDAKIRRVWRRPF